MKTVHEFLPNTSVIIVDDDTGCYIQNPETNERLINCFNSVLQAVNYACSNLLPVSGIQFK